MHLMADGVTCCQRPIEMDASVRHVATEGKDNRLRRLQNDERVNSATRTSPHGNSEAMFRAAMISKARQRAGLSAKQRSMNSPVLSARQFSIGSVSDRDDLAPILLVLEVRATREIVREVVPRTGRKIVAENRLTTIAQKFGAAAYVSSFKFKRCQAV
jgi:hypothetical protein